MALGIVWYVILDCAVFFVRGLSISSVEQHTFNGELVSVQFSTRNVESAVRDVYADLLEEHDTEDVPSLRERR